MSERELWREALVAAAVSVAAIGVLVAIVFLLALAAHAGWQAA